MGFYAGKPIENTVYCFIQTYKCGKHSSLHNKFMSQFRKVDHVEALNVITMLTQLALVIST